MRFRQVLALIGVTSALTSAAGTLVLTGSASANVCSGANPTAPICDGGGSRPPTPPSHNPYGSVDSLTRTPTGGLEVSGWAIDPDTTAPVPILVNGGIQVSTEASYNYTWDGSKSSTVTWSWKQPLTVPAYCNIGVTVTLAVSQISVPYTLTGQWISQSGVTTPGTITGTFTGLNSHDLAVNMQGTCQKGSSQAAPTVTRVTAPQ